MKRWKKKPKADKPKKEKKPKKPKALSLHMSRFFCIPYVITEEPRCAYCCQRLVFGKNRKRFKWRCNDCDYFLLKFKAALLPFRKMTKRSLERLAQYESA